MDDTTRYKMIEELRLARHKQADIKDRLYKAQQEYDRERAYVYVEHSSDGHYKAKNHATKDRDVNEYLTELNKLKVDHYRAWIESSAIAQRLNGANEPDPDINAQSQDADN